MYSEIATADVWASHLQSHPPPKHVTRNCRFLCMLMPCQSVCQDLLDSSQLKARPSSLSSLWLALCGERQTTPVALVCCLPKQMTPSYQENQFLARVCSEVLSTHSFSQIQRELQVLSASESQVPEMHHSCLYTDAGCPTSKSCCSSHQISWSRSLCTGSCKTLSTKAVILQSTSACAYLLST